jgi:UDP-3-O-[3-hydroxymyristoyl] glucosamine N-acyltransferase
MSHTYTVSQLADLVGGTLRGDGSALIAGVAEVSEAGPNEATWVSRSKYEAAIQSGRAGVVLVPSDFPATPMPAILCEHIDRGVAALLGAFAKPVSRPDPGIHPTAIVHSSARIGESPAVGPHVVVDAEVVVGARCIIHAGVFIGRKSVIGDECEIWPHVVIRDGCTIGQRVIIHPNAVIGADGFGYYFDQGRHNKVPHGGGVFIGDDVEIGACSCVDRSKFGNTVIGRGTKIDNFVQIAHNCRIGEHCVFVSHSCFAGSVRTGDGCVFGARSGVLDNIVIGRGVTVAGITTATKNIADGQTVLGFPAQDIRVELRERAALRRLPELLDRIKGLIERVERLEASAHHNP